MELYLAGQAVPKNADSVINHGDFQSGFSVFIRILTPYFPSLEAYVELAASVIARVKLGEGTHTRYRFCLRGRNGDGGIHSPHDHIQKKDHR